MNLTKTLWRHVFLLCAINLRTESYWHLLKGALSCLRQFLATENHLKMVKNAFYFALKVLFVINLFTILS